MQWESAPFTPASLSHPPPASPFGGYMYEKSHQRKRTNDQMNGFDNGFLQTPATTCRPMTSSTSSIGDLDSFLVEDETNDRYPENGGGLQLPIDFGLSFDSSLHTSNDYMGTPPLFANSISERSSPRLKHQPQDRSSSEPWFDPIVDHHPVVASRDGWSYFKCNPTSSRSSCPKTARIHLEGLEHTLKNQDAWQFSGSLPEMAKMASRENVKVQPFDSFTRDKLLAITQTFVHKASKVHSASDASRRNARSESPGFIILPPPNILEHFLRAYVCHLEPHYPSIPSNHLYTNELIRLGRPQATSLLLLLMIALGASAIPDFKARSLTNGLVEACRISLLDVFEKNTELVEDLHMLRCGLLMTMAAAWSGDKWHMDVSFPPRW